VRQVPSENMSVGYLGSTACQVALVLHRIILNHRTHEDMPHSYRDSNTCPLSSYSSFTQRLRFMGLLRSFF
jgi:hypothetical protein